MTMTLIERAAEMSSYVSGIGQSIGKNASAEFLGGVQEIVGLHISKGADYGKPGDTFANMRAAERIGIEAWRSAIGKMSDKWSRIESFCTQGRLENESFEDSLLDIANYALIALTLYREKKAAEKPLASGDESTTGHEVSDK